VFVVLLGILLALKVGVSSSTTNRLDDALKRGNLVSPAGSSARDYYNQLKNENASQSTLATYREKLLPQLTRGPQSLLDDLTSPGGRDGTLPEWEEAQKLLAWATELKPEDKSLAAKSAYAEGRTAYLKDRIEDALSAYQRAADFDKSWAPPVNSIGSMLNEHKRYSESRTYLREAIRRNPNWALPYNNMGTSYFYENNFSDAQSNYRKAVSLAPNWARPHAWLGSIAAKQKDYCAAVGEFEQALRLSTPGMSNWDPQKIQRELDVARERCVVVDGE
jgi:tetratricopeptide (TPR) repeat protein